MALGPGKITLWGIEVFVAPAEERSISAAARRLGASPSAVSQQLTNLETAMGVTLLERNARPVRLTPAGETFRRRASSILNEAAQARAELASRDLSALTRVRLGMIEDFEADVTPQLLARLDYKTLVIHPKEPLTAVPDALAKLDATIRPTGELAITFRTSEMGIGRLLEQVRGAGIGIGDLVTEAPDLEDVFLALTSQAA